MYVGQAVMKGVEIFAVPLGKKQFACEKLMNILHICQNGSVEHNLFHFLFLPVQQRKGFVMVSGIIDKPVIGINYALCSAAFPAQRVNVALPVFAPFFIGQRSLIVAEASASYTFSRGIRLETAAGPAERFGLPFGDKVFGKSVVKADIQRYIVAACICSVFIERLPAALRFGRGIAALRFGIRAAAFTFLRALAAAFFRPAAREDGFSDRSGADESSMSFNSFEVPWSGT